MRGARRAWPSQPARFRPATDPTQRHLTRFRLVVNHAGNYAESQQNEVKFPEISAKVLEKTVQYFYYKLKHTNHQGALPQFPIEPDLAPWLLGL